MATEMCFSRLPQELKLFIFSYFNQEELVTTIAPVCSEWWQFSHEPSFWRKLTIGQDDTCERNAAFPGRCRLLQRCQSSLRHLKLSLCRHARFEMDGSLVFSQLRKLRLRAGTNLSAQSIAALAASCRVLEEVDLGLLTYTDNVPLYLPLLTVPSLTVLTLYGISNSQFVDDDIRVIASSCPQLRQFRFYVVGTSLSDAGVEALCTLRRQTLTELTVCCHQLTGQSVRAISQCRNLRMLRLSECQFTGPDDLLPLAELPSLIGLHMDKLTTPSVTFRRLFSCPTGLRSLSFSFLEITDSVLSAVAQHSVSLRDLSIDNCERITDRGVAALVDGRVRLRILYVALCRAVLGKFDPRIEHKLSLLPVCRIHHGASSSS